MKCLFYFFQISRPQRFTTTRVDEAEHAASVGRSFTPRFNPPELQEFSNFPSTSQENVNTTFKINSNNKNENAKVTISSSDKANVTHGFNVGRDEDNK